MQETEMLALRLRESAEFTAILSAGWDAFEFIQQTASAYDDPESDTRGYAFTLAAVAACHGRNALGDAPSLPDDDSAPDIEVCVLGSEDQAAEVLGDLARVLERRLSEACAQAADPDRRACEMAAAAAAETRILLASGRRSGTWAGPAARPARLTS